MSLSAPGGNNGCSAAKEKLAAELASAYVFLMKKDFITGQPLALDGSGILG